MIDERDLSAFYRGEGTASTFRALMEVLALMAFHDLYTDGAAHYLTTPEAGRRS